MITETELKELNDRFDILKIASGLKCPGCKLFCETHRDTVFLHNLGYIPIEDNQFLNCILNDLETHIRENHPDRAEYFLDKIFKVVK